MLHSTTHKSNFMPLLPLLTLLLTLVATQGAASALNGEVFVAAGTTGTNALPSSRTTNTTVLVHSTAPATTTALIVNTAITHTSGNLVEVQNNSTNILTIGDGYLQYGGHSLSEIFLAPIDSNSYFDITVTDDDVNLSLGIGATVLTELKPTYADGGTPYLFDTSSPHTTGNLVEVKNNGTNLLTSTFDGSLFSGYYALDLWPDNSLVVEKVASMGNGDTAEVTFEAIDSLDYNQNAGAYFFHASDSNAVTSRLTLQAVDTGSSPVNRLGQFQVAYDVLQLSLHDGGTPVLDLKPTADDGNTPFLFNTTEPHETSTLFVLQNASTNVVTADVDGGLTVGRTGSQGSLTMSDADGSNTHRRTPSATITTDINEVGPDAPFSGIATYLISSTTNFTLGALVIGSNLTYTAATRTLDASGGGGASDNWVASGTTNSTLPGVGSANGLIITNTATIPALYGSDGSTRLNVTYTAYSAGTAYSLTATPAALDFGTTDPSITLSSPGTYRISATANIRYNGATFAANRTVTIKLRRTNNTAADLTGGTDTYTTDVTTTITETFAVAKLDIIYTTSNSNDAITIFGDVSATPSAGSLDAVSANVVAFRLYE